ncbi:MAG: Grx4 family monothiol glutaredoxin [Myxococcota bacterium]|nr:Grx4 family monothiol glutaredoxin [Myxococcota bacterium]
MSTETQERIKTMVSSYPVMLFMKGTPDAPQCGFSSRIAMILKDFGKPFASFNVLSDPEIRQGIKTYANWPTIPQLYINGEFVGGSDIVSEMFINGELTPILEAATADAEGA